ncbi:cytochrome P450 76C4-like [Durio zibethinus]|uniref:Cytochrome P450 76C4-like n=1 Tax=Durio zibethinus TaxID=66656 RepID=A0A6P5ZQC3_DURZI|nr:cytochrome P450 76C4-like [Durio zibethinus]
MSNLYDKVAVIACEELETVVGNQNIVEESHLPRLLYLEAVAKETLRIHPAAPLLVPHMPSKTCVVAGYTIPKHSRVAWATQRDPEFWEGPLEFEPERFLKDTEKGNYVGNNFHFFPIGSGRRTCVGIPLAEKMVAYVLAVLVYSFEWELPDIKEKLRFVLSKVESLAAIPIARLSIPQLYR